ncbi:MAG: type II toxin-antitoxin system prevent-host-death family antitoxin [Caldilineaceae bacterium]|nr:type II toxin-antitoxin system prevent-host-death family antitoxin [Caldilineaceae bacterium]
MQEVNVEEAQNQLPQLLTRVEAGEEVVITREGEPVARLVNCLQRRGKRQFGALKGRLVVDGSFFDPLPEEELSAWEGS